MRPISINNDSSRHEQQQRLSIPRQDSICNAMTLISDKYETLYAEVKREMRERAILSRCKVRRLTVAYRRKMRCNYNSKTRLRNNDRYAEAVVHTTEYKDISSLDYIQFIRTLEREVEFEDKRSSIYYYTKIADNTVATKLYRATFVIKLLI
ncbi:hypothetical protein HBI37_183700 [Parastagonospora nodorum]|nr:hypothetical protein HBI37_183700 [Parastagonospora nodorum]KAH6341967.1 hypothetical protein HBI36_184820 [Parastagonospora nodorum]